MSGGRRSQRKTATQQEPKHIEKLFQKMSISELSSKDCEQHHSSSESEAECPKCGLVYGEDDSLWICCENAARGLT